MRNGIAAVVGFCCVLGCGDNSKECGPGTIDEAGTCAAVQTCGFGTTRDEDSGECVPDGTTVCSEGTRFDALTGTCKIDPTACQAGTVLVNNACVDPTAELTIDVQEGPEPNGLGIVETSGAQAGTITLKPAGETFVVRGTIDPWRDGDGNGALDPDVDTFVVTVAGPVLLRVTADGLHGVAAGFVAVAVVEPSDVLASWRRWGVRLVGDTSRRQLWLPKAGTYRLAIGDTRTLAQERETGDATAAPGGPEMEPGGPAPPGGDDGTYYVSLTDLGAPALTTLTASMATGMLDGESLAFYASTAGTGIAMASLAVPAATVQGALVAMVNGAPRAVADETSQPARVSVSGLAGGDVTFVVVDHVFDTALSPSAYSLTVSTTPL